MNTNHPVNAAFALAASLNYNASKVEFAQVLTTANGSVNLVALSQGQRLDRHTAPASVAVVLLEGEVTFTVDGKANTLRAGDALLMEAGAPHEVEAVESSKILLVKIDN